VVKNFEQKLRSISLNSEKRSMTPSYYDDKSTSKDFYTDLDRAKSAIERRYGDPLDPKSIDFKQRKSYMGDGKINVVNGFPINPYRLANAPKGRGILAKWGPNFAADPLITRIDRDTGELKVLVIQREDTGHWAFPGGMVDFGEKVTTTALRELGEEAVSDESLDLIKDQLLDIGSIIYEGYADDPRNTQNAWMETAIFHMHLTPDIEGSLQLEYDEQETLGVKWLSFNDVSSMNNLYGSHSDYIQMALSRLIDSGVVMLEEYLEYF